jgi:DNA-binding IclR family transcriptional regulator
VLFDDGNIRANACINGGERSLHTFDSSQEKEIQQIAGDKSQKEQPLFVKSVARALAIINYVVKSPKPPTFTMIQEVLDVPKSSLSYLLQELVQQQYLQFDSEIKVYYPGLQLIRIGATCINNSNFSDELWRGIRQLSEELGETTHAVMLEDRFVIFIAKNRGAKEVSAVSNIGFKLAAHATAGGKMLLSSLDETELDKRLATVELEKYTDFTITSYAQLKSELTEVRENGYATDNQANVPGGFCVAAPVYDKTGKMIAAISISVLAGKITDEYLSLLIQKVKTAAQNISTRLGKV